MKRPEPLTGVRQSSETNKAVLACNDYLRLGKGRSLAKLADKSEQTFSETGAKYRLTTLFEWSSKFDWQARAAEFDALEDDKRNAEREKVFSEGLALDFERVKTLRDLAAFLLSQIYETGDNGVYHNVWLPDAKVLRVDGRAEIVDTEKFNGDILTELRGTLADLAKETGGRAVKQQHEHTGKNGNAIEFIWSDKSDNSGHGNTD